MGDLRLNDAGSGWRQLGLPCFGFKDTIAQLSFQNDDLPQVSGWVRCDFRSFSGIVCSVNSADLAYFVTPTGSSSMPVTPSSWTRSRRRPGRQYSPTRLAGDIRHPARFPRRRCQGGTGTHAPRQPDADDARVRTGAVGASSGPCKYLVDLVWSARGVPSRPIARRQGVPVTPYIIQGVTGTGGSGGGGNRTRVRKPSVTVSTCLSGEFVFASPQPPQPGKEDASLV